MSGTVVPDFPELANDETYFCVGEYAGQLELVIPLFQRGQDTYCDFRESNLTVGNTAGLSMLLRYDKGSQDVRTVIELVWPSC